MQSIFLSSNFKQMYSFTLSLLHVLQSALVVLEITATAAVLKLLEVLGFSELREFKSMDNLKKNRESQGDEKEKKFLEINKYCFLIFGETLFLT